jgi:hypothetical protein
MPNPNRPAFKKADKKLRSTSSISANNQGAKKAAIVKYDTTTKGGKAEQKSNKRFNQSELAKGRTPYPVYEAGDAQHRRAEFNRHTGLNSWQFGD